MRKSFLLIVFVGFFAFDIFSQNCDNIIETNLYVPEAFNTYLKGVKYASLFIPDDASEDDDDWSALKIYLENLGFEVINKWEADKISKADIVYVYVSKEFDGVYIKNIELNFISQLVGGNILNQWHFKSKKYINLYEASNDIKQHYINCFNSAYSKFKPSYDSNYKRKLPKKITCWNTTSLKAYYSNLRNSSIEGIYESTSSSPKYKLALKKINDILYLIYLSGANNVDDWQEGEIKATLEPTATRDLYKAYWIMSGKGINEDYYISFENGLMNVLDSKKNKDVYLKMFPTNSSNITPNSGNLPSNLISTGTGFAISSKGYIVTNYHVIEDASSIKVRGINNNFSTSFNASVIASDKNSDLAILKINDSKFTTLGTIPYTISTKTSDVGSSVYVLGYPLLSTMGQEVKVTNGIVSSKSGYSGDISSYQISAPIQPGNSGGPLLDSKGNIIGIINAKHKLAENASYAIKSNYLLNLIESLDQPPVLQSINSLNGKSFTEQLKVVKNFTYIIEIY